MRPAWIVPMLLALPRAALGQDLTTLSTVVSPTTVEVGTTVAVSGQFGGTHLGNVEFRVVVSSDSALDPSDITIHTDSVVFGGTSPTAYSTSFPMPVIPAASWTLFVEVDSNGMVTETDNTNNELASAQLLVMRGADLRIGTMEGPDYAFAGGPFPIDLVITNEGEAIATNFRYNYYYSDTPNIRVFSTPLGQFGPISIPAGGQLAVADIVTLPTSTATGYIGVIIDQYGDVSESNINNNIGRIQHEVRILEPSPELSGRIIEIPMQAAIGEQLAITRSLENSGVAPASFEYVFYFSTDATISATDFEIGRFSASLGSQSDDYVIDLMNVSFDVLPGNYFVGLIVDPANTNVEPNEEDNIVLGPQVQVYESAIRFMTESLPNATVGVPYEVGVYATGPLATTFSVSDGALPTGMALDPAGLISGTPTENGRIDFTLRAHSGSAIADRRFSIVVVETTVPLEVVPISLPTGVVGRPYFGDLIAVGGQTPYTWSAISELPQGLMLSPEGRISGVPILDGQYPLAVRVEDAIGEVDGKDFILRVITPDQTLEITQTNLPSAIIGEDYCGQSMVRFEAIKGVEPYTWSAATELPPGMTLATSGELCGTPTRVGSFAFSVRAGDETGLYDTALFVLEVLSENTFAISTTTLDDGELDQLYEAQIDVFGGDMPLLMTVLEGAGELPPGLTLAEDGKITGIPTAAGVFAFVAHVVDGSNRSDTQPLSIAVSAGGELEEAEGGCSCTAAHSGGNAGFALLLLLGLFLIRGNLMRQLSLLLLTLSLGLLFGCPKDEDVLPPEVARFEVVGGVGQVRAGETVTLAWEARNAVTVQITATPPGMPIPNVAGNIGTVVSPELFEPTTFQLNLTGADGARVSSDAIRVDVRGIRIQSFTATPNTIDPGQTSTLEWVIGGDAPTEVVLLDAMGTELLSDTDPEGSFPVTPNATTTYTLTVAAESGTDEETVTVMVADIPPQIINFFAEPDPVAIGSLTTLRWETAGAYQVQVLKDGVVRRPWNVNGAEMGSVSLEVDSPSVMFTLQARTQTEMMLERTITVSGLEIPIIDQFDLTPVEYTQASTTATAVWATTNTNTTTLRVNGTAVPGFPGTASGSFDFTVSGGTANVTLVALNDVGEDTATGQILSGFNEPEPNDTATTAIALTGDGLAVRGTIDAGDADYYAVMVPEGARIHAIVGWDGTNCSFDTMLDLFDSDRTTRLGSVDDTNIPFIAPCSRINPAAHAWADDLAAGTYYLRVASSTTAAATGTYSLTVEVTGPEAVLAGTTITPIGNPSWRIADVVQMSVLIGNANTNPPFRFLQETFDALMLPLYGLEGFLGTTAGVHPIFRPVDPNAREYDGVLSALAAIAGYQSKTTFTRAEFEADNAILVLFVLDPGPTSPIESSYDFAAGPVLQTELFPMTMDWDVEKDGMPWYEGDPFDLLGYHQYMPPVPGSGSSHRIAGVVLADLLQPPGDDSVGMYDQTFAITDPTGAGWSVTIPVTVTE